MTTNYQKELHNALASCVDEVTIVGESEHYSPDVVDEIVTFLDSCCWALAFGGPFADEIVCVANEVIKEGELRDTNRHPNMDNRPL